MNLKREMSPKQGLFFFANFTRRFIESKIRKVVKIMEKPYTKEQLLKGIETIDNYLKGTEHIFLETESLINDETPEENRKEWEECIKERRSMKNIRTLFIQDLRVNHGIIID